MSISDSRRPCGCPGDGDPHLSDCPILTAAYDQQDNDHYPDMEEWGPYDHYGS